MSHENILNVWLSVLCFHMETHPDLLPNMDYFYFVQNMDSSIILSENLKFDNSLGLPFGWDSLLARVQGILGGKEIEEQGT